MNSASATAERHARSLSGPPDHVEDDRPVLSVHELKKYFR
ncbi:MAG: Dipeptide/oligopeptide/nickel ABC transporter ATP-binding protein, partial [Deltaproteobacteria bacterium]|nr:Dipeptide/oligopeptide/nickel ABC transporter ATP-binding protein [Deltaproteobacteria bacterium]